MDTLMHVDDGSAFDREWQEAAQRTELAAAQALARRIPMATHAAAPPQLSHEDRRLLREGRDAHTAHTANMLRQAQQMREDWQGDNRRPRGRRY